MVKERSGDNLNKAWTYGNSILLQLNKHLYVFISHNIYCFKTNEEIIKYYSLIGNSDVPYPVALSKNYAYFMLDCQQIERKKIPKDTDWPNGYSWFYGHATGTKGMKGPKFKGVKVIAKRLW